MKIKQKKLLVALTALGLAAIFIAGAFWYKTRENERLQELAKADREVFVRPHAPQLGNKDAKVYVIEFLDPECESCREAQPAVKRLLADFPERVKLVIRYIPNHPNSQFAIKVLEAARKQGKYWDALDLLFHYQPQWGDHHKPQPELILQILPQIFVDVERLKKDMNDPAILEIIRQDLVDASQLGVRGTPTFFVNGKSTGLYDLGAAIAQEVKEQYE